MKILKTLLLPIHYAMYGFSFLISAIYSFFCNIPIFFCKKIGGNKTLNMQNFWERQKDCPENFLLVLLYLISFASLVNIFVPKTSSPVQQVKVFTYQNIHTIENSSEEAVPEIEYSYDSQIDFASLLARNSDTIGYLEVSGTNISYPVVQTTDNDYYLDHDFNHNYSLRGAIFADYRNSYSSLPLNNIIYGHHRLDNTMFGPLDTLFTQEYYASTDHQIFFLTQDKIYIYEVFSVYEIDPEIYYLTTRFNTETEYMEFLITLKSRSLYDFGVDLEESSRILTLSTCNNDNTGRLVVHAKLVVESSL